MVKRTHERKRKQPRSAKRKRVLLQNVEKDVPSVPPEAESFGADGASEPEGDVYQHHSILRTNNSASMPNVHLVPPPRRQEGKNSAQKRAKKTNFTLPKEAQHDGDDSSSDASVSDGVESSSKELGHEAFSNTWRGGKENCVELLRGSVEDREVAVFKVSRTGIALAGAGWIRVVRGTASVLGADLTAASASLYIVSAPMAPFAVTVVPGAVPTEAVVDHAAKDLLQAFCNKIASSGAVSQMKCNADECIVLFAENCKPKTGHQEKTQGLLKNEHSDIPSSCEFYLRRAGLPTCADGATLVRGLNILGKNDKLPCFTLWKEWGALTTKLSSFIHMSSRTSDLRVLVCGGSGTGKSMAVRCTINYLLSQHQEVVLIDTDVGQPEMNIPGLVAAHAVRRMRGGAPAASNRRSPVAAAFFGDITPRENPDLYVDCIRKVVARGRAYADEVNCPVIINSDGWISGVGADLLQLVFKCATPSHVISMVFADSESVADGSRAEQAGLAGIFRSVQMDRMFHLVSPLPARTSLYSGVSLRDLHVATYFSDELDRGRVRVVSIDDVQVATVAEPIEKGFMCAALNACVVALACTEGRKGGAAEWNVRGFGMVRAVDTGARNLYVATPVAEAELLDCDALIVSAGVQVPSGLFLAMAEVAAPWIKPPYISSNVVATGGHMKSRPSLHRRR